LVLGVLRWQCLLDQQLKDFLKRPGAKLDREVLIALRMGAFQLLHLDRIPASAAIDESVELAKHTGHRFASGMVNAVLRKLAAVGAKPEPKQESPKQLAMAYAHPEWMVARWAQFYGMEAARVICNHGQTQPTLAVRLASPNTEEELSREGIVLERSAMLTSARIVTSGEAAAADISRSGRLRIQDEGSQLVS
jgi:16S rRNA (cytosine967-C5)-methyltransferase